MTFTSLPCSRLHVARGPLYSEAWHRTPEGGEPQDSNGEREREREREGVATRPPTPQEMLHYLKGMDVGFFSSVARLIGGCSVLNWSAYERYNKTESSQDAAESACGQALPHATFTSSLFRFLQLLCEGHNAGQAAASGVGMATPPWCYNFD